MLLVRRGDGLPCAGEAFSGAGDGLPGAVAGAASVVADWTSEAIFAVTCVLGGSRRAEAAACSKQ